MAAVFMALLMPVFVGMAALSIDITSAFVEKREMQNAADAATLAAASYLPSTDPAVLTQATNAAIDYAARNGVTLAPSDVVFSTFAMPNDTVTIEVNTSVGFAFAPIFGVASGDVGARASARRTVKRMDVALLMDDTGTMNGGCNAAQTNTGCPIKQARDGANALLDVLIPNDGAANVSMALVPFRGCYNSSGSDDCVRWSEIVGITANRTQLRASIAGLRAEGGSGTNICGGLTEGYQRVFGAGSRAGVPKVIIILTDADNNYDSASVSNTVAQCRPTGSNETQRENAMDVFTNTWATAFKTLPEDQRAEIFVLRFAYPSGDLPATTLCNPAMVGMRPSGASPASNDNWDRNLGRCIASSTPGSNDHYRNAPTPADIPVIFESIIDDLLGPPIIVE